MNINNNIPIDPRSKFSTLIGELHCHSLLNNISDKSGTVYKNCFLNGETKAKARIRVKKGKEITFLSHRELKTTNKVTWKVKITDDDKKILDARIFELV